MADSKFRDQIPCANATTTMQEPLYNASIKYGFLGLIHRAHQSVTIQESYVVEFIGMRDSFAAYTVNGPNAGTFPVGLPNTAPNAAPWLDGDSGSDVDMGNPGYLAGDPDLDPNDGSFGGVDSGVP